MSGTGAVANTDKIADAYRSTVLIIVSILLSLHKVTQADNFEHC